MRSVKGIIIGFLLILLGFAAAQYSLIAAGILSAGGLAAVVVSALPKRAEKQEPHAGTERRQMRRRLRSCGKRRALSSIPTNFFCRASAGTAGSPAAARPAICWRI